MMYFHSSADFEGAENVDIILQITRQKYSSVSSLKHSRKLCNLNILIPKNIFFLVLNLYFLTVQNVVFLTFFLMIEIDE